MLRKQINGCVLVGVFLLAGCSTIGERYKQYDPNRRYLKTEKYFSEPLKVPSTLNEAKLEDYYPVPDIGNQSNSDKPALNPPSNTLKGDV